MLIEKFGLKEYNSSTEYISSQVWVSLAPSRALDPVGIEEGATCVGVTTDLPVSEILACEVKYSNVEHPARSGIDVKRATEAIVFFATNLNFITQAYVLSP